MKYSHHQTHREVGRAKDLSAPRYKKVNIGTWGETRARS